MKPDFVLVVITVLVALIFDFLNGFHDSANSIATVVSTRVLSPKLAVLWAAAFNFLAAFFLGSAEYRTDGSGDHQVPEIPRSAPDQRDQAGRNAHRSSASTARSSASIV